MRYRIKFFLVTALVFLFSVRVFPSNLLKSIENVSVESNLV